MRYLLTIYGRLDNLNDYISAERSNKFKAAKMKAENEMLVTSAIRKCLKGVHITKPVEMYYEWHETNARRDKDNISSFGRKVIQDALVKNGVLQNDGWKNISCFTDSFFIDQKNPRIMVLIREVDGEEE